MAKDNKDIEGEEEGSGGGKLKLIVIIVVAAVLLIGGGTAAFFLLGSDDEAAEGESTEEVAEVEEPAIEEGEPLYVDMKPQFVVNLPPGGPAKMLQVAITIYTRQAEVGDWITKNDPMIRHHMIELLEEQDGAALLTVEGKQALQAGIEEFLRKKLEEMSQPGEIKGVFFTEFVLQ